MSIELRQLRALLAIEQHAPRCGWSPPRCGLVFHTENGCRTGGATHSFAVLFRQLGQNLSVPGRQS